MLDTPEGKPRVAVKRKPAESDKTVRKPRQARPGALSPRPSPGGGGEGFSSSHKGIDPTARGNKHPSPASGGGAGERAGPGPDTRRRPVPAAGKGPDAKPTATLHHFFSPCPRGLEAELIKELAEIGAGDGKAAAGGVAFSGSLELAWRICLWSRLAIRVLWRVGEGNYRSEQDLYDAARALDWPAWFDPGRTIAVTTVGKGSPLKSLNFVSLKIKDAVCDRFRDTWGERPSVDTHSPDVPILLHLGESHYNLYLDLSGEPLNRRGYRVQPALAPLNENLAAGLLKLAGWHPGIPFYDPMMGGGTLLLEAALMALNIAPGIKRHFAFEKLRNFDMVEWQRLRKDAEGGELERTPLPIFGTDIDPDMVRATGLNLKAAGVLDCVRIMEADFLNVDPPAETGIIVTNPPYGVRLSMEGMAELYQGMGDNLKKHFPGWHAWLFSADPDLPKGIGLKATRRIPLYNGPLECRLYEYRLVAGGNR